MALLIRLASEADAAPIAALYAPFVEDSRISFEETAPDAAEMAGRIRGDVPGLHPWLVAEENGRMLGFANSSPFRSRPAYRWSVETGVYLATGTHGRGVGTALLTRLLAILEEQGFVTAIGAIALPNPASVTLHEKLGFAHAGTYRGTGFKFGEWIDVGLWQKQLAPRMSSPAEPRPFAEVA